MDLIKSKLSQSWPYLLAAFALLFSVGSLYFFEYKGNQQLSLINEKLAGEVAGASNQEVMEFSSKDLPIIPGGDLLSFDRQNNTISMLIEIDKEDTEIKSFYDDYLFQHLWLPQTDGVYKKDNQTMNLLISNGVIKITISNN